MHRGWAMKVILDFRQHAENFPGSDFSAEAMEFAQAMAEFQRETGRRYPSWREVLQVAQALGYRRVAASLPEER